MRGRLLLMWLAGIDLRLTLLAVPPLLPLIHRDLGMDEKTVAALSGLPVLLLGLAAIPGSLLIARIGPRRALIAGLLAIGCASALRGIGPSIPMLFVMTLVMGAGVSVIQPAFPSLVGQWFPSTVGLATAVYANGLLVGEAVAAAATIPLVLPLAHGSWGGALAIWGLPVIATAALIAFATPHVARDASLARPRWWPEWRAATTWQLGIMQGGVSAIYFGANAFLPDYLHAVGRPELVGACLSALNAGQLPASIVLLFVANRLVGRRATFLVNGALDLVGLLCLLVPTPATLIAGSVILGFCSALVLIAILALPPLIAGEGDVHRVSAGMFSIGYTTAFLTPLIAGAAWDATHIPGMAFLPVGLGVLLLFAGTITLKLNPEQRRELAQRRHG